MLRLVFACLFALAMIARPEDLPPAYQPWSVLDLSAEPNFITRWKLHMLGPSACRSALSGAGAGALPIADRQTSDDCHVRGGVQLTRLSKAGLSPADTRCEIAARLYLWERHDLQPAALAAFGVRVAAIEHYSSYSCRPIRTSRGSGRRMSEHATANAFDISGFVLADGRRIALRDGWETAHHGAFLRAARDGLCRWFNVVLSPDYNALHADHFHVDMGTFMTCR